MTWMQFLLEFTKDLPYWMKFILILVGLAGAFLLPSPIHGWLTKKKKRG